MNRLLVCVLPALLLAEVASVAFAQTGDLQVEIQKPASELRLESWETSIEVEGGASIFGGVKYLDLFLVMDSSKSLRRTDPKDYRAAGAIGLVTNLSAKSDIRIGVVEFDKNAELVAPLTPNRAAVIAALDGLDRSGDTNLAAGIETALAGFEEGARPDSSRVMLLFTDGKSNAKRARWAMEEARRRGVAIHTLLLGSDEQGAKLLREIAEGSGGSFVRVTDPAKLPEAFLNLRTTGIEHVDLRVNGSSPIPTALTGGTFSARVPLQVGENEIVATATSLDGRDARGLRHGDRLRPAHDLASIRPPTERSTPTARARPRSRARSPPSRTLARGPGAKPRPGCAERRSGRQRLTALRDDAGRRPLPRARPPPEGREPHRGDGHQQRRAGGGRRDHRDRPLAGLRGAAGRGDAGRGARPLHLRSRRRDRLRRLEQHVGTDRRPGQDQHRQGDPPGRPRMASR